jgi:branched-chain amino acid transport system substrate-binding protein
LLYRAGRSAAAAKPIVIGHQAELTGVASIFGFWNDRAARAAVARLNNTGGIAGRPVKLVTRDSASNPNTGLNAMRELLLRDRADFVLGSIIADINKPSAALAGQFETLYFPSDDVPVTAGQPEANRFVFRLGHNTRVKAQVTHKWALANLGKRWTFLSSDTTWGRDQVSDFSQRITANGGEVVGKIFAPLLTQDFTPLFNQVDLNKTEVLYHTFFGGASVRFYTQGHAAGIFEKVKSFASIGVLEGISSKGLVDGQMFITEFPRQLDQIPAELREYNVELRKLVGVDPQGVEIGGKNILTSEHYWVPWVNLNLLKRVIEATGWQSKADNRAVIEALEGFEAKASLDFPSGDFIIRPQDHRAFRDYFIEKTQGGKLLVVARFPKEQGLYPPPVDYTAG